MITLARISFISLAAKNLFVTPSQPTDLHSYPLSDDSRQRKENLPSRTRMATVSEGQIVRPLFPA